MPINKLLPNDKLRFEDDANNIIATLSTIDNDKYDENVAKGSFEIVSPVYGDPYLKFKNTKTFSLTKGSIKAEGTKSAFDALVDLIAPGAVKAVTLKIGGSTIPSRVFFRCIITSVITTQDLTKTENWIVGQISYIKI